MAHILVWFLKRIADSIWQPLDPIPRSGSGTSDPKQRPPSAQPVQDLVSRQEDSCYQVSEMGRVHAEMIRATVDATDFGGFDFEMLRVAALARARIVFALHRHERVLLYELLDRDAGELAPL